MYSSKVALSTQQSALSNQHSTNETLPQISASRKEISREYRE
jgi:hypothetical protein